MAIQPQGTAGTRCQGQEEFPILKQSQVVVDQQLTPNFQANGSDPRGRPWTYLEGPQEEEMALEWYQALSWNVGRTTHITSS